MRSGWANQFPTLWQRQVEGSPTRLQVIFDVVFGVVVPVLCLRFDLFVFRGAEGGMLSDIQLMAYWDATIVIGALALWLLLGARIGSVSAGVAVILFIGTSFPLLASLFCLQLFLSLLEGWEPWVLLISAAVLLVIFLVTLAAAFAYFRNALRAFRCARQYVRESGTWVFLFIFIPLVAFGVPAVAQVDVYATVMQCTRDARDGREPEKAHIEKLKWAGRCGLGNIDPLVREYGLEQDRGIQSRLARVYKEITGADIEARWVEIRD